MKTFPIVAVHTNYGRQVLGELIEDTPEAVTVHIGFSVQRIPRVRIERIEHIEPKEETDAQ